MREHGSQEPDPPSPAPGSAREAPGADLASAPDAATGSGDDEARKTEAASPVGPTGHARSRAPARRGWGDFLAEPPEAAVEVARHRLDAQSRRDFLLFAAGLAASVVGGWWLLPDQTRARLVGMSGRERLDTLAARVGLSRERRERLLDGALTFDDDVAEALYSKDRRVRTYARSEVTALRNNYHGRTPGPEISSLHPGRISGPGVRPW